MSRRTYYHFLALGIVLASLAFIPLIYGQSSQSIEEAAQESRSTAESVTDSATAGADTSSPPGEPDTSILLQILGADQQTTTHIESWSRVVGTLIFRLALAALLAALLAFRPRKSRAVSTSDPYVAETQILLAVVAAALMMIVGDNTARAFGIFAAASLVRFRTNIRDPKEITVLLVNLGIGLAAGVGRWELAIMFSLFILLLLRVLEHYEPSRVFRSMELKVRSHHVEATDRALRDVFKKNKINAEVRGLDREDQADALGRIVYRVDVSLALSTDRLAEEIFSSDPENVDSVEWHQKKALSYTYR